MDGAVLDVAIGLVLIFFVFSLVVSGIFEGVAKVLAWRAKSLWAAIHALLGDVGTPGTAQPGRRLVDAAPVGDTRPRAGAANEGTTAGRLYAHPLVGALEQRARGAPTRIDRVESANFARALVDTLVPDAEGKTSVDTWAQRVEQSETIPVALKRQLAVLVREAGDDFDALRAKIEAWFDAQMAVLTHRYRKRARWFTAAFGLVVAAACNVDAVHVTRELYRDDVTRAALTAQAEGVVGSCGAETGDDVDACLEDAGDTVSERIELPVGWGDFDFRATAPLGWVVAGVALSQGAPFWFDVLKRATRPRR